MFKLIAHPTKRARREGSTSFFSPPSPEYWWEILRGSHCVMLSLLACTNQLTRFAYEIVDFTAKSKRWYETMPVPQQDGPMFDLPNDIKNTLQIELEKIKCPSVSVPVASKEDNIRRIRTSLENLVRSGRFVLIHMSDDYNERPHVLTVKCTSDLAGTAYNAQEPIFVYNALDSYFAEALIKESCVDPGHPLDLGTLPLYLAEHFYPDDPLMPNTTGEITFYDVIYPSSFGESGSKKEGLR